jgi:hypothetical protein
MKRYYRRSIVSRSLVAVGMLITQIDRPFNGWSVLTFTFVAVTIGLLIRAILKYRRLTPERLLT